MRAPQSPPEPAGLQNLLPSKQCVSHRLISLIVFQNGHISGALAELIRSTRAPTNYWTEKDTFPANDLDDGVFVYG